MPEIPRLVRIPSLKTVADFQKHIASLEIDLPCEEAIAIGSDSPLARPVGHVTINGKKIGNRFAIQPMEGWDGTHTGGITDDVRRRWKRFGESGAKLICGGEAMAVRPDGRANPHQLLITGPNQAGLAEIRQILVRAHRERFGSTDDLVIGFQLTHSGRFCKPNDQSRLEPRVVFRHPLLDPRFGVTSDEQVFRDTELEELVGSYVQAARIAWEAGADFVDIKHCHGYLLHELLGAYTRPGRYGGSFENRTRLLRDIVQAIRADGNRVELGVRLSAFDLVPFKPDPLLSRPGKPGPGIPEDYSHCLPYRYGFGVRQEKPTEFDLTESFALARLCLDLGVKIINVSGGSPYYNPHVQRPAAYPPSDGYLPPEDPLAGVARQILVTRRIRESLSRPVLSLEESSRMQAGQKTPDPCSQPRICPMLIIGSAYSYLQEYLPHVAQYTVRHGWTDLVGIGRMVLAYPDFLSDAVRQGSVNVKSICRTFSDCTTAPRAGLISGCYPLDAYYAGKSQAQELKAMKKGQSCLPEDGPSQSCGDH
jgi:NADPH2 dehydrogenase